jgi:hypothetical protein
MAYTALQRLLCAALVAASLTSTTTASPTTATATSQTPAQTTVINWPNKAHPEQAARRQDLPGFVGVEADDSEGDAAAPPAYTPVVTPSPEIDEALQNQGYSQTTYYECRTLDGREEESCGWHVPVIKLEGAAPSQRTSLGTGYVVAGVGGAAALFAMGLL